MINKKALVTSSFSMILALTLAGCSGGSYTTIKSKGSSTATSTEMSYSSFKGSTYKSIKLKANSKLILNIDVKTEEGNLKIALNTNDGDELFSVENPSNHLTENINIPEDGTYFLEISGEHKGSYDINWDIVQ